MCKKADVTSRKNILGNFSILSKITPSAINKRNSDHRLHCLIYQVNGWIYHMNALNTLKSYLISIQFLI